MDRKKHIFLSMYLFVVLYLCFLFIGVCIFNALLPVNCTKDLIALSQRYVHVQNMGV